MPSPGVSVAPHDRPIGLILAGGRARRMGGGDKGLQVLGGRPVLHHIARRLIPQVARLALNANGDPARFAALGLPVVPDHGEDREAGPLAGVLAGLDWTAANCPEARWMLSVPGDTPFLPEDLVTRLADAVGQPGAEVPATARSGGRDHPTVTLWPLATREPLRHQLRHHGTRRLSQFLDAFSTRWVDWAAEPRDPFFNINTPDDLAAADTYLDRTAL